MLFRSSRGARAARPVELAAGAAGLRLGTSAAMGLGGGRPWWADSSCWRLAVGYGDGGIGDGGLGWQRTGSSSVDLAAGLRLVTSPVAGLGGGGQGGQPWRANTSCRRPMAAFFLGRVSRDWKGANAEGQRQPVLLGSIFSILVAAHDLFWRAVSRSPGIFLFCFRAYPFHDTWAVVWLGYADTFFVLTLSPTLLGLEGATPTDNVLSYNMIADSLYDTENVYNCQHIICCQNLRFPNT